MSQQLQLMYLMCSRFCHDLAAPLGAIAIGLEMLDDDPAPDSPQSLLIHSVKSAMNKLEMMRCLSGYATQVNRPTLTEAQSILEKCIDPEKISIKWQADGGDNIKGTPARLYVALMMITAEALPRGGEIILNKDYSLTVRGPLVKFHESVLAAIASTLPLEEIDSRNVIGFFIKTLADDLDTKVLINFDKPNDVRISFK